MFTYRADVEGLTAEMLSGFFVGWPNPPSPATHLATLQGSTHAIVASHGREVVGFITALSDGTMAAFIPLLEVRAEYQGQGIGTELVRRMLLVLAPMYSVDIVCDADVAPFHERLGLQRLTGMAWRNRSADALVADR